jgi:hypothetical protein
MRLCGENDNDAVRLLVSRDPVQPKHMAEFWPDWEQIRYGELLHVLRSTRKPARVVCLSPPVSMEEARWLRSLEICLPPWRRLEFLCRQEAVIINFKEQATACTVWDV